MQKFLKFLRISSKILIGLLVLVFSGLIGLYLYLEPELPSIEGLSDVQLQVPLRVYSSEGALIAEYGEKRRSPKVIEEIPEKLRQAFLSAEDDRFYQHPGVDYQGILRAVVHLLKTGERGQGGSTITMQLARNFYLSREKTFARKLNEIFLALKIEQQISKDAILELYLNKIYLGNRAYGVAAASRVYYGKELHELDLAQIAMIAGLPKAPSRYNPIINPDRAVTRRNYVLNRMGELGFISEADQRWAKSQPVTAGLHDSPVEISAYYVAEMVRSEISQQFGEEAYTKGLKVYTTIDKRMQKAANSSLRHALLAYDQRHGYRGAEQHVEFDDQMTQAPELEDSREEALEELGVYGNLVPALVVEVGDKDARVYLKGGRLISLDWSALSWAKPYIDVNHQGKAPESAADILKVGDIIRIYRDVDDNWRMGQVPEVQGALTALVPNDGAIKALVGGFDFHQSKFNRAVQARRQAGSSFKPFIYTSALEKQYTAASIINDAPVVFHDPALEGTWRPENYSGKFYGPTRLREALVKSRNLVSIRLLRSIGVRYATQFAGRFGFNPALLPRDLSLALGSGEVSPLNLSTGFAVFANGGYRITPYFIDRIEDLDGKVLFKADPAVACVSCVLEARKMVPQSRPVAMAIQAEPLAEQQMLDASFTAEDDGQVVEENLDTHLPKQAERAVEERVVYIMNSILQDVIKRGTGRRARALGRSDLHGKTGTTNDQRDGWFNGFNSALVATAWVGFDQQQRVLGNYETGSKAALPMWIEFMRTALQGVPESTMPRPENLVTVKINPETGELADVNDKAAIFEIFRAERAPTQKAGQQLPRNNSNNGVIPEQLF
ncbi:MAG: penicillin-binding protein 1A [Gammaproteobacteria bacterium]|nr:penicillin-binding protein 1A [Gammaproteobacteria bacterium]